ncbi:hypothetical protein AJ79_00360 [Helicocarpus griseus UAMH5409]|uniref:Uncharacterized protein n=1 Tax=Helicocarpus griseus UAMH5409 TaxID=1447875 RepID=A0A2B7YBZ6_9EURO|nr:hypothetical protein AJ79_00360 [Helicocarpus griseus UAMH5409]
MDVFYTYTYGTGAWLTLQGVPLFATPKMIIMVLLDEARSPSMLEIYFARSFGLTLLSLAALTMLLTGSIPLTTSSPTTTNSPSSPPHPDSSSAISPEPTDPKAPYAVPTVLLTSAFHASSAFYTYAWFHTTGEVSFALAMAVYGGLAAVGLWCLLFASSGGRISRRTGADKRTSGFPFRNAEAERKRGKGKGKGKVF